MVQKKLEPRSVYNDLDLNLIGSFKEAPIKIHQHIDELRIHDAVEIIFSLIRSINKYLEEKAPWKTIKEFPGQKEVTATTLYVSIECIRICTQLLHPVMPSKTKIVLDAIRKKDSDDYSLSFGEIIPGQEVESIPALFPKRDE